jgi:RecA/RadA recombinase
MSRKKKVETTAAFDLLSADSFSDQIKDTMLAMASKRKSVTNVSSMQDVAKEILVWDNIHAQAAIGMKGFPYGTLIEIIGQDGVGKTSFVFTVAGEAMRAGAPFFYVETENKPMDKERVKRCLGTDPSLSDKMFDRITVQTCDDIPSMVSGIEDFVDACRNKLGVPPHIPIVCAVDSFSKLMAPNESEGRSFYSDVNKKQQVGEAKVNFGHSKFAHQWCRMLPSWLRQNNVILFIISHQNQSVSTGFGGGSFMSAEVAATYNRTKIGGNAFNQNAALQLIITRKGLAKQGTDKVGTLIKATVAKNSYGPEGNVFEYEIISKPWLDTATYQQPSLYFDGTTASWLAQNSYLGVVESRKRYTCDEIGAISEKADTFCQLLNATDLTDRLGTQLRIIGYPVKDTSEDALEVLETEEEVEQAE